MTIFSDVFGVHEQESSFGRRDVANCPKHCNADTPNYQAKDLDFRKAMKQASDHLSVDLSKTKSSHLDGNQLRGGDLFIELL